MRCSCNNQVFVFPISMGVVLNTTLKWFVVSSDSNCVSDGHLMLLMGSNTHTHTQHFFRGLSLKGKDD